MIIRRKIVMMIVIRELKKKKKTEINKKIYKTGGNERQA